MSPENELRQLIREQEAELEIQSLEIEGLFRAALDSLQWKSILTHSLTALLQFQPLQQLLFKSTLRVAGFKLVKGLLQKFWPGRQRNTSNE